MELRRKAAYVLILFCALAVTAFMYKPSPEKAMIEAAEAVIESLSPQQKSEAIFTFEDTARNVWHFLPVGNFDRFGIPLSELSDDQDEKVYNLLKSVLSDDGYDKATTIISLENILKALENNSPRRDPQQYHISLYGTPGMKGAWGWGFTGHHLSLHFTMVNGHLATTPTFMGTNPGEVQSGPQKGLRVLEDEEDKALALVNALSEDQRKDVVFLEEAPYEIFTAAESEVHPLDKHGLTYDKMEDNQQKMLMDLVEEYLSNLPDELADLRRNKIRTDGWDDVQFAWAGVTDRSGGHYYRVQGKSFLIEFDNTQNEANHVHTVWRDFDGDFGRDLLAEHRKSSH